MIPRIRQVHIKNYKSIAGVSVDLGSLTALVGPNGSGKSNFLDALAFVQESLSGSIELAFKNRGGASAVRRISGGHPTHIGVRLVLDIDDDVTADYSFEIAARPKERFRVARERCVVGRLLEAEHEFEIRDGTFEKPIPGVRPQVAPDRLALFAASATEEFRPVYDFLTGMRFYSIVPSRLRELQDADPGDSLKRDGANAAAVLKRLWEESRGTDRYDRLCRLLGAVVGGVESVEYRPVGVKETLQFRQDVGLKNPWKFEALNMSDGTLRVLGLLLAVYQTGRHPVVGVEEPEATVHPAVAELIVEVLIDASKERQVLFTTHSPDILDHKELGADAIRVVSVDRNRTLVSPLAESGRRAVRDRLYTLGELHRSGELNPDTDAAERALEQLTLFGPLIHEKGGTV